MRQLVFLAIGCVLVFRLHESKGTSYHVTDLGIMVFPKDLNDHGHVVGTLRREHDAGIIDHPFYWRPTTPNGIEGILTELPMLPSGDGDGSAESINNTGQIAGSSDSATDDRAVLWSPVTGGQGTHSLHVLGNPTQTISDHIATAINEAGQIAGSRFVQEGLAYRPTSSFLWTPDFPNGNTGAHTSTPAQGAIDLNDHGILVGRTYEYGSFGDTINHGVIWSSSSGVLADLGQPPGTWRDVFALGINNLGQIVGYAERFGGSSAFLWTPTTPNGTVGVMQLIPDMSFALDINDHGTVVGHTGDARGAMLWTANGGAIFLQDLVAPDLDLNLSYAYGINNKGQIIVAGNKSSHSYGLLLTPIPEPNTAVLTLLGFLLTQQLVLGRVG